MFDNGISASDFSAICRERFFRSDAVNAAKNVTGEPCPVLFPQEYDRLFTGFGLEKERKHRKYLKISETGSFKKTPSQ